MRSRFTPPKTLDNRPIVTGVQYPENTFWYRTGIGDNQVTGVRGGGQEMIISKAGEGDEPITVRFCDACYFSGGTIYGEGAHIKDSLNVEFWAPASTVEATPGLDGDCFLAPLPAPYTAEQHIIVPAIEGFYPGTHRLLTASPLPGGFDWIDPNPGISMWDWGDDENDSASVPLEGKGELFPKLGVDIINGVPTNAPRGHVNLFDFAIQLSTPLKNHPVRDGRDDLARSTTKPLLFLPQWEIRVKLTNRKTSPGDADHTVHARFVLEMGRCKTYGTSPGWAP